MADNAPTAFTNVADAVLRAGIAIWDSTWATIVGNERFLYEKLLHLPGGNSQQNYGHAHGELSAGSSPPDGITKRRTIYSEALFNGGNTYAAYTVSATMTEVRRVRCAVGPFRKVAAEIRYSVDGTNFAKVKLTRHDWVDSANAATTPTSGLQAQTTIGSGTAIWYTLDGQAYSVSAGAFTGSDTKLMPISGPTSLGDLDEMCANAEFVMAISGSAAGTTINLYNLDIFEVLSTDEDGSSDAWLT